MRVRNGVYGRCGDLVYGAEILYHPPALTLGFWDWENGGIPWGCNWVDYARREEACHSGGYSFFLLGRDFVLGSPEGTSCGVQ